MAAPRSKDREERLFALANRQFGLLRHDQLIAAGLDRNAIAARVARRRLTRVQAGVYAFGHTALQDEGRWLAAVWTCAPEGVLSHFTAAAFHGWRTPGDPEGRLHISTTASSRSREDIAVHRTRHLEAVDVFTSGLFRVTHQPRTLVDLADVMPWDDYRALADSLPSLRVDKIRAAQARTPRRSGAPLVTRLIDADDAHTKSEFERRFLRFLTAHRLPRPDDLNVSVAGHKADCVYRTDRRLVIELDGRAHHRRRAQMRADRRRDSDYQLAGYRILRLVWDDLHAHEAARTASRVRRMLAA
ncbi:hypothetical protein DSM112329_01362 [Paraconexibacter sp. AEG42_29]|uniref:DUF559 domain-containing protein n=1 Tax=Paraconexibacter sp. AEG42_29 TaxID=2997339 RepID=A0AAU7ASF6_9ACTN